MIIWICTDMEGLSGVNEWDQFSHPDDNSPKYLDGIRHLHGDVNAAVAGCFDAGATEVRVLDGHGRNRNKGLRAELLDPRAKKMWIASRDPLRWEGLDESVTAVAMIGQHAMAGTVNGYTDHTQSTKTICALRINGEEHGEMSQFACYAGGCGAPLMYVSGDEALCAEAARLFPHAGSTPTKRGTGWATCDLYPVEEVRANIRRDIASALGRIDRTKAWKLPTPVAVEYEFAWSELADHYAPLPGVRRPHARRVGWTISDQRDIYDRPSPSWKPASA